MTISKADFWNKKILKWEKARYSNLDNTNKLLDFIKGKDVSNRLLTAVEILNACAVNRSVLELGCGSGRLFKRLSHDSFESLTGVDLSIEAIKEAQNSNESSVVSYLQGDFLKMELPNADFIIGLGVLDWLSLQEIKELFSKIESKKFVFSFSEKKIFFRRILHRAFIWTTYGRRNLSYTPQYYSVGDFVSVLSAHSAHKIYYFSNKRLGLGAFISNFSLSIDGLGEFKEWQSQA